MKLPGFARIPFVGVVILLAAGCALAPGASPTPTLATVSSPSSTIAPPSATPTGQPPATTMVVPSAPSQPSGSAEPTASDNEPEAPPNGEIHLPDGTGVPGYQGSWCYDSACADIIAPDADLPIIAVNSQRAELTFLLAETHPFAYWNVRYASDENQYPMIELATGGTYQDVDVVPPTDAPHLTGFSFSGLPKGTWRLQVNIQFAGARGDAGYLWWAKVT